MPPLEREALTTRSTIHFYGSRRITELPAFFSLARALVLPSIEEEWGLVVNEAMSSGCPVIVSERAGCSQDLLPEPFVGHEPNCRSDGQPKVRRTGILFDPNQTKELVRALELISICPKLREEIARNADTLVAQYSPRQFAEHLIELAELVV